MRSYRSSSGGPRRLGPLVVMAILVTVAASSFPLWSTVDASSTSMGGAASPIPYVALTRGTQDSCLLNVPAMGDPGYGDLRASGVSAGWTSCVNLTTYAPLPPLDYGGADPTTGNLVALKVDKTTSFPKGNASMGPWFYRGEFSERYMDGPQGQVHYGLPMGLYGYDTLGVNGQPGSSIVVPIPTTGSPSLMCPQDRLYGCGNPEFGSVGSAPQVSGVYPSFSGSSAVVGIGWIERIPWQNITVRGTSGVVGQYNLSPQYSQEVVKRAGGSWVDYEPSSGPTPSQWVVKNYTCYDATTHLGFSYQALEQTRVPTAVTSSGEAAFAFLVQPETWQEPSACQTIPYPGPPLPAAVGATEQDVVVADVNVGGVTSEVQSFHPPYAAPSTSTCQATPPCFQQFAGMTGDLLFYTSSAGSVTTTWLYDTLHGSLRSLPANDAYPENSGGSRESDAISHQPFAIIDMAGKASDGVSAIWKQGTTKTIRIWNGHLGVLQNVSNDDTGYLGPMWVDASTAAWVAIGTNASGLSTPGAVLLNVLNVSNSTLANLAQPSILKLKLADDQSEPAGPSSSSPVPNGADFGSSAGPMDVADGNVTWVTVEWAYSATSGTVRSHADLHWANLARSTNNSPAGFTIPLPWVNGSTGGVTDLVAARGWVYLAATVNGSDRNQVGNHTQIYAVELPRPLFVTSGTLHATLGLIASPTASGPWLASADSRNGAIDNLTLTSSAAHGGSGSFTILIPKAVAPPTVNVSGQSGTGVISNVSVTRDVDNVYLSFTASSAGALVLHLVPTGAGTNATSSTNTTGSSPGGAGNQPAHGIPTLSALAIVAVMVGTAVAARRRR
ncbi:MAG: hypothetical protein ACYDDF_04425 [Thermoplasmatota archaeon]